jgi:hypothetical protein
MNIRLEDIIHEEVVASSDIYCGVCVCVLADAEGNRGIFLKVA